MLICVLLVYFLSIRFLFNSKWPFYTIPDKCLFQVTFGAAEIRAGDPL